MTVTVRPTVIVSTCIFIDTMGEWDNDLVILVGSDHEVAVPVFIFAPEDLQNSCRRDIFSIQIKRVNCCCHFSAN